MVKERKRRKAMTGADKYHARKMREIGMSIEACADYFDVSVATLCRGLAELREKLGPEEFVESRRHLARAPLRTGVDGDEHISNT